MQITSFSDASNIFRYFFMTGRAQKFYEDIVFQICHVPLVVNNMQHEYISNNVFSKLDIQHSIMHLPMEENLEITQNKAKGYELIEPSKFKISTLFHMSMYPSGGINGTTEDLAKFAMALMPEDNKESVLFEYDNTLKQMLSQSYSAHEDVPGIAHGFQEYNGKLKGLTHAGNTASFSSNFILFPKKILQLLF